MNCDKGSHFNQLALIAKHGKYTWALMLSAVAKMLLCLSQKKAWPAPAIPRDSGVGEMVKLANSRNWDYKLIPSKKENYGSHNSSQHGIWGPMRFQTDEKEYRLNCQQFPRRQN